MDYNRLFDEIWNLETIDTHEHLIPEKKEILREKDFFNLFGAYVPDDLITAGMPKQSLYYLYDKSNDFKLRWNTFKAYLELIENTAYFRPIKIILKDIYQINDFELDNIIKVNKKISNDLVPGFYKNIFNKCNIKKVYTFLTDHHIENYDDENIVIVPDLARICPRSFEMVETLEKETDISIINIKTLEKALESLFSHYKNHGIKAIKFTSGYYRTLNFDRTTSFEAEKVLNKVIGKHMNGLDKIYGGMPGSLGYGESERFISEDVRPLENYIIRYIIYLAQENKMTVFFHTGMHAWILNKIERCHAYYLNDLVEDFPKVKFVLLHSTIPFIDEAMLLCKYYPNVYLNLTWVHIIDSVKARELLKRVLEFLPINKITAFGGDYVNAEAIYGHLRIAKENVANVLYEKIKNVEITPEKAIKIAKMWFYDNAELLLN